MSKRLNVAMIGYNFMGRAHTQAWRNAPYYFDLPGRPTLKVVCGRSPEPLQAFAERWGWEETETDWRQVVARPDIDIVDIASPTSTHHEIALAAARAGKHIFCEKPMAMNAAQAQRMLEAARQAGVVHYLNHNYRRCPAVALAKELIREGRLGRLYHWRGAYLQSWIVSPEFPLTWQLQAEHAGGGPHYDLNSHSIDLALHLVGEIRSVMAMTSRFISERPLPAAGATAFQGGTQGAVKGPVTVEDAAFLTAEFANGALGSFAATRFALGRKNYNAFEIYGSRGALAFNLERMNELEFYSEEDPACARGFRNILATEAEHPYIKNWWPPGHIIGYEHAFTHAVADFLGAIAGGGAIAPDFEDGLRIMRVLEAALTSARTGQRIAIGADGGAGREIPETPAAAPWCSKETSAPAPGPSRPPSNTK